MGIQRTHYRLTEPREVELTGDKALRLEGRTACGFPLSKFESTTTDESACDCGGCRRALRESRDRNIGRRRARAGVIARARRRRR